MLDCEPLPPQTDVQSLLEWADRKRTLLLGSHQVQGCKENSKYVKPSPAQNLTSSYASPTKKHNTKPQNGVNKTHCMYFSQDVTQLRRSAPLGTKGEQGSTKVPGGTSTQHSSGIADDETGVLSSPRRKVQGLRWFR